MATQQINIQINSTGARTVVRNLNQIAGAATGAISPIARLERALRAAFVALGIKQVLDWADAWTAATNKVAVFSDTQEQANEVMDKLYGVSQRVRQPLEELVTLYHRVTIASKDLNTTIAENIAFTENIGKALAVQGTSATQARGALLQLSQAMGEGIVRAQEFNSMVENMPLVLQLVAKEMHGAGGSISSLRKQMLSGKLASKDFYDAFMRAQPQLDEMFEKTNKTFGQAFITLENGLTRYIGQLNQSLGLSNKFYALMSLLANNLDTIGKLLAIVAVSVVAAFAPAIIAAFVSGLQLAAAALLRLTLLLLANPFVAIVAATAAVIAFSDSWDAGIDGITSVQDVLVAMGTAVLDTFYEIASAVSGAWDMILGGAEALYNELAGITTAATQGWSQSYADFFADTGTGFAGWVRAIAKVMDAIAGLITGVIIAIGRLFGGLPAVISAIFGNVYNAIAGWMEKATNVVISGINIIRSKVGMGLIDSVKFDRLQVDTKVFQNYGESISSSITAGFDAQGGYMQKKVEDIFGNAQQRAYKRLSSQSRKGNGLNDAPEQINKIAAAGKGSGSSRTAEKAAKELASALESLLSKIDPVSAAMRELAKGEETLNAAMRAGLITEKERSGYMEALKRHYADLIDPLGAVVRGLDKETQLLKLGSSEREREVQFRQIQEDLLKQNVILSSAEVATLKEKIALNQQLNEQMQIQDGLLAGSIEKRRTFASTLEQIAKLQSDPTSGFRATDGIEAMQAQLPDLFAGTKEATDLQVQLYRDMYDQIRQMRDLNLISEQTAVQMKMKVANQEYQQRVQFSSDMYGTLATLASSSNKRVAAIGKAAAITQATIDGVLAVQKALASAPYPYNLAMAAAVGVSAASNVAKIVSSNANFATGGDFTIGGSGGVDSQLVAFRGSPGEKVSVSTPQQVRKGTATKDGQGGSGSAPAINVKSINVLDAGLIGDYLNTDEGEILVMNIIQRNKGSM